MDVSSSKLVAWLTAICAAVLVAAVPASAAQDNSYSVHVLASNESGVVATPDADLVNGWGLTSGPGTPWWVSDNGTDKSTLYTADGTKQSRVVNVPGGPTGAVFWSLTTTPAFFVFATEGGQIRGWHPPSNDTFVLADGTSRHASYKGIAISPTGNRFYATDFHNQAVDVFDSSTFSRIIDPSAFTDPSIPSDYAPFGIQTIGSRVFVTYAKKESPDSEDELHGQGLGFVDAYDLDGNLLARVAQHGQLNAPWGIAWAPSNFGRFGGDLLVGNFGDGQINAYEEPSTGQFVHRGELRTAAGKSLSIDGLWALQFGHGAAANGPTNTLFFTAGPDDESNGLFGSITAG
jgi:uncharacterized protein (TIGR03118 family)